MSKTKRERELEAAFERELDEHLAELDADRAVARRFFWKWLLSATAMTLLGNAGHALLPPEMPKLVRLAVALTPPLVALIAIHGVTVLARVGAGHRERDNAKWTFRAAVGATVLLALDAAAISFNGLYSLALDSGYPKFLAVLFPLAIDAGIALATLAIYHLRPASAADLRAARTAAKERHERERRHSVENVPGTRKPQVNGAYLSDVPGAPQPANPTRAPLTNPEAEVHGMGMNPEPEVREPGTPPVADQVREPAPRTQGEVREPDSRTQVEPQTEVHEPLDEYLAEAHELSDSTKVDLGTLTHILAGLDDGVGIKPLARDLDVQHGVVRRIRDKRLDRRPHLVQSAV